MAKRFKLPETCHHNQWSANILNDLIDETAIVEQVQRAFRGDFCTKQDITTQVKMAWLDTMMPAGNC